MVTGTRERAASVYLVESIWCEHMYPGARARARNRSKRTKSSMLEKVTKRKGIRTYEIAFEPQRCGDSKKALLKGTISAVANFGKILQQCCGLALRAAVALRQPVA